MRCPSCRDRDVILNEYIELSHTYFLQYICYECGCEFEVPITKSHITIIREGAS
jgi:hypothetical protein